MMINFIFCGFYSSFSPPSRIVVKICCGPSPKYVTSNASKNGRKGEEQTTRTTDKDNRKKPTKKTKQYTILHAKNLKYPLIQNMHNYFIIHYQNIFKHFEHKNDISSKLSQNEFNLIFSKFLIKSFYGSSYCLIVNILAPHFYSYSNRTCHDML